MPAANAENLPFKTKREFMRAMKAASEEIGREIPGAYVNYDENSFTDGGSDIWLGVSRPHTGEYYWDTEQDPDFSRMSEIFEKHGLGKLGDGGDEPWEAEDSDSDGQTFAVRYVAPRLWNLGRGFAKPAGKRTAGTPAALKADAIIDIALEMREMNESILYPWDSAPRYVQAMNLANEALNLDPKGESGPEAKRALRALKEVVRLSRQSDMSGVRTDVMSSLEQKATAEEANAWARSLHPALDADEKRYYEAHAARVRDAFEAWYDSPEGRGTTQSGSRNAKFHESRGFGHSPEFATAREKLTITREKQRGDRWRHYLGDEEKPDPERRFGRLDRVFHRELVTDRKFGHDAGAIEHSPEIGGPIQGVHYRSPGDDIDYSAGPEIGEVPEEFRGRFRMPTEAEMAEFKRRREERLAREAQVRSLGEALEASEGMRERDIRHFRRNIERYLRDQETLPPAESGPYAGEEYEGRVGQHHRSLGWEGKDIIRLLAPQRGTFINEPPPDENDEEQASDSAASEWEYDDSGKPEAPALDLSGASESDFASRVGESLAQDEELRSAIERYKEDQDQGREHGRGNEGNQGLEYRGPQERPGYRQRPGRGGHEFRRRG